MKDPSSPVIGAVAADTVTFEPTEHVHQAVKAFERYDLVSAPVVDDRGKLVGRLTVDTVMDLARDEADLRALKRAGLTRDEDLFAGPWDSARNRWPWLAINLVTAFAASRVIGRFEGTISGLVRARHAHAHRRQHRRQHRQSDDGDHDSRAGGGPGEAVRRMAGAEQGAAGQPAQRIGVGRSSSGSSPWRSTRTSRWASS